MSCIKEANTVVNADEGVANMNNEKLKFKPYPKPYLFNVEEGVRVYSCELIVLLPGKIAGMLVCYQVVTKSEVFF